MSDKQTDTPMSDDSLKSLQEAFEKLKIENDTLKGTVKELRSENKHLTRSNETLKKESNAKKIKKISKEPERFAGTKNEDWHGWVRSMVLYLRHSEIESDEGKISVMLSFLKDDAAQTAQPYFQLIEDDEKLGTFKEFLESMGSVYGQRDREGAAKGSLETLKMTGSAGEYTAEFVRYAQLTRYSEYDKKERFIQGLAPGLMRAVINSISQIELDRERTAAYTNEPPEPVTLDELMREAVRLDNVNERIKRYTGSRGATATTTTKPRPAPRATPPTTTSTQPTRDPNAMEVDPPERPRPTCYNCNKVGHVAKYCRAPRQPRPGMAAQATRTTHEVDYSMIAKGILEAVSGLVSTQRTPPPPPFEAAPAKATSESEDF